MTERERFSFPFRVRYSEIDAQAIVFNAHYLTYFDTAITEYLRWLPYDYKHELGKIGCDFHTVRALVEYKAPLSFDEEFDVFVQVGRVGRSSVRFDIEVHGRSPARASSRGQDLRATGDVVWVNTDQSTGQPEPVPDALSNLIAKRQGAAP